MSKRTQSQIDQTELLAKLPPDAKKVLVITEKGEQKYKSIDEVSPNDAIQTNKAGEPVVMKAAPGRRKAPVLAPATPVVGELIRKKEEFIEQDPIRVAVKERPDDPDVLHQVMLGLVSEAGSLAFERAEAERNGTETSNISIRRVNALKAVGDTWLKRKDQIVSRGIDFNSPAFQAMLKHLLETFRTTLEEAGARPEMIETIFAKLAKAMGPEWEAEAKNRMKAVV